MSFIQSRNQTVSLFVLSIFLSFTTPHIVRCTRNYDGQFELANNPYCLAPQSYKPLPPSPSDVLSMQRHARHRDQFEGITFKQPPNRTTSDYHIPSSIYDGITWQPQEYTVEQLTERMKQEEERTNIKNLATKNLSEQSHELSAFLDRTVSSSERIGENNQAVSLATARRIYLQKYKNDPDYWYYETYSLSEDDYAFLQQHAISTRFSSLYANHALHGIHTEHITIISQAATVLKNNEHAPSKTKICSFVAIALEISHTHKIEGDILSCFQINDLCMHFLNPMQHAYLAPQLALLQGHAMNPQSTDWQKAFLHLEHAAQLDPQLATCMRAASCYANQFKKTDRDYELQVLEIVTELSDTELSSFSLQEQFAFLEKHHEGIALQALRSMHNQSNHAKIVDYAIDILGLDYPHSAHDIELLQLLLTQEDSLMRTQKLACAYYQASGKAISLSKDGLLHEHAMMADVHQLSVPQQNQRTAKTHQFLHTYFTTDNVQELMIAKNALCHQALTEQCSQREQIHVQQLLVNHYYDVLYNKKQNNFLAWSNDLAQIYNNPLSQEVHNELTWLTTQVAAADSKATVNNALTSYTYNAINDLLSEAHAYIQLEQPEKSHEIMQDVLDIFIDHPHGSRASSPLYKKINFAHHIAKIGGDLSTSISSYHLIVNNTHFSPNEKIAYLTNELSRLHIQSGSIVRDAAQLSQKEWHEFSERSALQASRHPTSQTLLKKMAKKACIEFDTRLPQFKKNLCQKEYESRKKEYIKLYINQCKEKAASCPERRLDILTKHINPSLASLKVVESIGFIIQQDKDEISILSAPEDCFRDFKEQWPTNTIMHEMQELWEHEIPLCALGKQEVTARRYNLRTAAYEQTKSHPYIFVERTYAISAEAQQLLEKNELDYKHILHGTHNPIQQQLHTELVEILEEITQLDSETTAKEILQPHNNMMLDFVATAAYASHRGDIIKTMSLADFCWATLDCGHAFLEGVQEGTIDALMYAREHPVETILFTVAGKYMLYYQVGKLAYELGKIAVQSYMSEAEKNSQPKEPIFFRDIVKAAANFGAQMVTNHAINLGIHRCLTADINKLSPLIDTYSGEISAMTAEHVPQLAKPQPAIRLVTDTGETIDLMVPQENFNTAENNAIKPIKNGRKTNSKKVHSQGENDAKKIVAAPMASDQNWMNRLSLKIHGKEAKGKICFNKILPKKPEEFSKLGWIDITHEKMKKNTTSRDYYHPEYKLTLRFDKAQSGWPGFKGKDHYQIYNPLTKKNSAYYLDKHGNSIRKNAASSHILIQDVQNGCDCGLR